MKFKSITSRIIVSVIPIILITTIIFIVVTFVVTSNQTVKQISDKMMESTRVAERDIMMELQSNANVTDNMVIFAENSSMTTLLSDDFKDFVLSSIESNESTVGGGLWFREGKVDSSKIYHSAYAWRYEDIMRVTMQYHEEHYDDLLGKMVDGIDYLLEAWFTEALDANGEMFWSTIYTDETAGGIDMITSSRAIFNAEKEMIGVSTADMDVVVIRAIVEKIKVGDTGRAFVIGSDGTYINYLNDSRTIEHNIKEDTDSALKELSDVIFSNNTSGIHQMTLDGKKERVYYSTLPDVGWKLIVMVEESEITASTLDLVMITGIVPVIGLILVVWMTLLVARHIKKILMKVNTFADSAAEGNFSGRIVNIELDEFGITETHLNRMIENMNELNNQNYEALKAAQAANQAKSEFLSRMSHEIRTPMNAIIGMTQVAYNTNDLGKIKNCLEKTSTASKHLLSLINDILDMSKIEANKFEIYNDIFDLYKTIEGVQTLISVKVDEKHQVFETNVAEDVPKMINGDEMRVIQVLINLLSNAVKFTPENGKIVLGVERENNDDGKLSIKFAITDTGIGMTKETLDKLFTSFEQADGGISRKYGGTGLGLAISKSIVELMGGKISVSSEMDKGSTFAFTIVVDEAKEFNVDEKKKAEEEFCGIPDLEGVTILVAEDIELNREVAAAILEETKVTIEFAVNGVDAVEKFSTNPKKFELILMDLQMPEMDGLEATRRIRALEDGKNIIIIALTANTFKTDVDDALSAGMDDFVPKPIEPGLLFSKLYQYIKK